MGRAVERCDMRVGGVVEVEKLKWGEFRELRDRKERERLDQSNNVFFKKP